MLTQDQITACWEQMGRGLDKYEKFARAIESAACAERDARIAELEASAFRDSTALNYWKDKCASLEQQLAAIKGQT